MSTLSMPSPHNHSHHGHHHAHGVFASSLQLSPAFRSLHAAALRQRQAEFERLRELARSDEFSDDESDGGEEEEEEEDEEEEEEEEDELPVLKTTEPRIPSPRDDAHSSDSDIDADETVLLPFIRPTIASEQPSRDPQASVTVSPKADDWTIVDKSPTCEGLVYGNVDVSESWFAKP